MDKEPMRDLIIVLPGILGSTLQKKGKDVWALSVGALFRGLTSGGIQELALERDPSDMVDLGDGVVATQLFPDAHLIPGLWKIDGYTRVTNQIRRVFDVTPGLNYFEFPYDWRRDNRVAARRLAQVAHQWLAAWREHRNDPDARIILVAHSMGGLVSRYYLEVLEGWRDARALITFGTPYRGALNALDVLANGFGQKIGPVSIYDLSQFVRSLTSVYQLLPIYPCYDCGDGRLVRLSDAAKLPVTLDATKIKDAVKFHHEIRDQVSVHQGDPAYRSAGYRIFPIVGTHQETLQSSRLEPDNTLRLVPEYEGRDLDGDGTVPRVSATPIELSHEQREFFVAQKHGSLQNADAAGIQLEGVLKSTQLNLSMFKAPPRTLTQNRLRLLISDNYQADEVVRVRVRPETPVEVLDAIAVNIETNESRGVTLSRDSSGELKGEIAGIPVGTYRITVSGRRPIVPISDLFMVSPPGG